MGLCLFIQHPFIVTLIYMEECIEMMLAPGANISISPEGTYCQEYRRNTHFWIALINLYHIFNSLFRFHYMSPGSLIVSVYFNCYLKCVHISYNRSIWVVLIYSNMVAWNDMWMTEWEHLTESNDRAVISAFSPVLFPVDLHTSLYYCSYWWPRMPCD